MISISPYTPLYHNVKIKMIISTPNDQTIDAYNKGFHSYLEKTPSAYGAPHAELKKWIDTALSFAKKGGSVLEIGSATSRDANYIRSHGFTVQCSDAANNFVKNLQDEGEDAIQLNIVKEAPLKHYDVVFANAVFPHFTIEDTKNALINIRECLNQEGILTFNIKQGENEEWVEEKMIHRYVHYWQPYEIYDLVKSLGYDILLLEDGIEGDLPTHIWTRIVAQKV